MSATCQTPFPGCPVELPCLLCLGGCAVPHLIADPAWCEHFSGTEDCLHQAEEGTQVARTSFSVTIVYKDVISHP